MPREFLQLADLYYELRSKGVKLPEVKLGPSMGGLSLGTL